MRRGWFLIAGRQPTSSIAVRASQHPGGWVLSKAIYRGNLSFDLDQESSALDELQAIFDLFVFESQATVRIPINRDGLKLLPQGSNLDGEPVEPTWQSDGSALVVEVNRSGKSRLTLSLRPTLRTSELNSGFALTIPRVADS